MMEQPEVKSEELPERASSRWIMEFVQPTPIADAESDGGEPDAGERWMVAGTVHDDRDRALSTMAFHERQHGPDAQRLVRIETRYHVESVEPEELQKWHDLAAKGDAEKAAKS